MTYHMEMAKQRKKTEHPKWATNKDSEAVAAFNLGNLLKNNGDKVNAEASYRRAIEINPKYADAHNNLGDLLQSNGDKVNAEASYRRAIEINPKHALAHNNLGILLKNNG